MSLKLNREIGGKFERSDLSCIFYKITISAFTPPQKIGEERVFYRSAAGACIGKLA